VRLTSAEAILTKALSLAPNHAVAHMLLGLVQMFTKRAGQAIAQCEHALALDRNLAGAHSLIGYAKYFIGRSAETEAHVNEALRLSPRDHFAHRWFLWVALAKAQLNLDNEAIVWLRRSLDANRNHSIAHFQLAAVLARLGELEQARAALEEGLALNPSFTIRRYRDVTSAFSDNPAFLAGRERAIEGMRIAGVPEG
jgi:tetratricopeptide (TPR) repeat protein